MIKKFSYLIKKSIMFSQCMATQTACSSANIFSTHKALKHVHLLRGATTIRGERMQKDAVRHTRLSQQYAGRQTTQSALMNSSLHFIYVCKMY